MIYKKDRFVSLLLSFFGGFVGAHRFYLGKPISGIFYLFTCGGFVVGAVVDFITLLAMPDETFYFKYNKEMFPKKNTSKAPIVNVADELLKLSELLDKNLITFEEFERRKSQLLY